MRLAAALDCPAGPDVQRDGTPRSAHPMKITSQVRALGGAHQRWERGRPGNTFWATGRRSGFRAGLSGDGRARRCAGLFTARVGRIQEGWAGDPGSTLLVAGTAARPRPPLKMFENSGV